MDRPKRTHGTALDAILLVGPGLPDWAIRPAEEDCSRHNLAIETMYTAGAGSIDNLRRQLHAGGKLGPHTQLLVFCHGMVDANGRHWLEILQSDVGEPGPPTVDVLRSLRVADDAGTPAEGRRIWPGTIHLISCHGGQLENELAPGSDAWAEGNYLVHASQTALLAHEAAQAITHVIASLAEARDAGNAPDPRHMLACRAHQAGDGITLLGSAVTAAASFGKPGLAMENIHTLHTGEWLKTRPGASSTENQALSGLQAHPDDAPAILDTLLALDSQNDVSQANQRERRLQNILVTSISQEDSITVRLLLQARPDLAEAKSLNGKSIEQLPAFKTNEEIRSAVLNARLSTIGPQVLLLQACARGDHKTALWVLDVVAPGEVGKQHLALAMEIAAENDRGEEFFGGLLEAGSKPGNTLARRCLTVARKHNVLPGPLVTRWNAYRAAHPVQMADDRRASLLEKALAGKPGPVVARACMDGDAVLLEMVLQHRPLGPGIVADRQELLRHALTHNNRAGLMEALANNALLHRDMETFNAMAAEEAGLAYLKEHGRTLLERACIGDRAEVAALFLHLDGIDTGADAHGDTLLHIAAGAGSTEVIGLLLSRRQAPDQLNDQGETALHAACRAGHDAVVRQLLEAGAATGMANAAAQTAMDLAEEECSPETLRLLRQQQAGLPLLTPATRV